MRKFLAHTDSTYKLNNIVKSSPNTKKIARSKTDNREYEIVKEDDSFYFLRQYRKNSFGKIEKFVQFKSEKKNMAIAHVSEDYIPMFRG